MGIFGMFDAIFPILFMLVFITVSAVIIVTLISGIGTWNKNNHSPRLTVDASVVAKRTAMHHTGGTEPAMHSTHTSYYATFQFPSGDRLELPIPADRFGYLAEGDSGKLTFQGTRFLDFERS